MPYTHELHVWVVAAVAILVEEKDSGFVSTALANTTRKRWMFMPYAVCVAEVIPDMVGLASVSWNRARPLFRLLGELERLIAKLRVTGGVL